MRSISKTFEMGRPVEVVGPIHMRGSRVSGDRAPCNQGNGSVTRSSTGVGCSPVYSERVFGSAACFLDGQRYGFLSHWRR